MGKPRRSQSPPTVPLLSIPPFIQTELPTTTLDHNDWGRTVYTVSTERENPQETPETGVCARSEIHELYEGVIDEWGWRGQYKDHPIRCPRNSFPPVRPEWSSLHVGGSGGDVREWSETKSSFRSPGVWNLQRSVFSPGSRRFETFSTQFEKTLERVLWGEGTVTEDSQIPGGSESNSTLSRRKKREGDLPIPGVVSRVVDGLKIL